MTPEQDDAEDHLHDDQLRRWPEPPHDQRCERHGDQRCQGRNIHHLGHEQPDGSDAQADGPVQTKLDTQCGGDAFATFESEKYRIQMPQEGGHASQGENQRGGIQGMGDEHGEQPLQRIAHQGDGCCLFTADAQYIGRSRVVGALGTRVRQSHEAADDDGAGNGAKQIGQRHEGVKQHVGGP